MGNTIYRIKDVTVFACLYFPATTIKMLYHTRHARLPHSKSLLEVVSASMWQSKITHSKVEQQMLDASVQTSKHWPFLSCIILRS